MISPRGSTTSPLSDWFRSHAQQYIGGSWCDGTGDWDVIDFAPYSGEKLAAITVATAAEVDQAYRAAQSAQRAWAASSPYERRRVFERAVRLMEEREPEIVDALVAELGATHARAAHETELSREVLREAMQLPVRSEGRILSSPVGGKENYLTRMPVGTVCVIAPAHFPLLMALKPLAAALALGNAVVLKPHQASPVCGGTLVARLLEDAGLPPGLLNVVITDIAEVDDAFIEHPAPEVICFTGSDSTGRHIASVAGAHFKRAILEMSGNSTLLVLDDADVPHAVNAAVASCFLDQGQLSTTASRLLVDHSVADAFNAAFTTRVAALRTGDPADPNTEIGPLMNPRNAEELSRDIQRSIDAGARRLVGGETRGNLVPPTVLTDVPLESPLHRGEIHGPVAVVTPVAGEDEAVRTANDIPNTVSTAIHTQHAQRGMCVAQRLNTSVVHVNDTTVADEPMIPFGGERHGGIKRMNGDAMVDAFTHTKWVSVRHGRNSFLF